MVSPCSKWLPKFIDKEVNVTYMKGDRKITIDGRLVFVDKEIAIIIDRGRATIFPIHSIDEITVDEKDLHIKSRVKVKELK